MSSTLQGSPPPPHQSSLNMRPKGGPKKPQGVGRVRATETPPALHPYEELRLKNCMQNSARLHQLGISATMVYPNRSAISQEKNKRYQRTREDSYLSMILYKMIPLEETYQMAVQRRGLRERVAAKPTKLQMLVLDSSFGVERGFLQLRCLIDVQDDGGDANAQSDCHGHSHMVNEDGSYLQEDTTTMDDCDNQMTDEEVLWNRGTNMGHGLQRINRARRGKLPIIIPEGQIRPLTPVIAAKYATECNIAVRSHVPILIRWKDYKKRPATIVKTSPVTTTSDAEWIKLVESWKTPKKMEACQKNKDNRALVKFPATTGSCSYPVFVENLGGEFEEKEPDAFDLFKLCHFSKKKQGYTPNVQLAIDQMETLLAASPQEGGDPKSTTEVVGDVLDDNTRKNMFLQNVGIQTTRPRSNAQKVQAELEVEKMANVELRGKVDDLKRKVEETEQERLRDKEEMMKKQAELEAKLEKLSQHRPAD